jgi:OOP family OmpA-OmpF porin
LENNMKLARASGTLGLAALLALAGGPAVAGESGWYGGFNVGQGAAKIDDNRISGGLLAHGFATTNMSNDDRDFGYKVFGGYQFIKYFAIEGGYFNLGRFGFTSTTLPPGTLHGDLRLQGVNLDAVAILPLTDRFSAFGRFGVNYADTKDTFTGGGFVNVLRPDYQKHAANYKFGFGLEYDFTRHIGMRAEAERYRIDDAVGNKGDLDLFSAGLLYRFGGHAPARAVAVAVAPPAVVAAPVLVVVPAPAATQQYCSILDLQFEINRNDIQREDTERLAVLGTFMTKYPDTTAVIEGHTDNVGTPEDNLKLSQRRADAVVAYLADSVHIDRSRLRAVGFGESRPVADNATEDGKRLNRRIDALVACATDIQGLEPAAARITMAIQIDFDTNKADVKPEYREQIGKVAAFMTAHPGMTATVEGHTSNQTGSVEEAMQLSQRRAQSVVSYLVDNFGIAPSRLSAAGFGDTRRFSYNTSAEGQQDNRRVNIIFSYPSQ